MNFTRDSLEDYSERHEAQLSEILREFINKKGRGHLSWNKIPAAILKKIWLDFGRTGIIRDEKSLGNIADTLLNLIARLRATTELSAHTELDPISVIEDAGYDQWNEKKLERLQEFIVDENGTWYVSDYGLPKLEGIYTDIYTARNPESLLVAIDRALNITHQRSDLAGWFVQGGTKTLNEIAEQK